MDQSAINALLASQGGMPQNTLAAEQSYLGQALAPQEAAVAQQQLNVLSQQMTDQNIIRNRLLQNAQNQAAQAQGVQPANPWKPPTNYAEMVADQKYATAENARADEYQKQIKPWMDYATKIGGKEGTNLLTKIMDSVMSDKTAPIPIKKQLQPFYDSVKSGQLTLSGPGQVTVRTHVNDAIRQKYNLPESAIGTEVDITTKENGELVKIEPVKRQAGDAMSPEAFGQRVQLEKEKAKAIAQERANRQVRGPAASSAPSDGLGPVTPIPGLPGFGILKNSRQIVQVNKDGGFSVVQDMTPEKLQQMILDNKNKEQTNKVRNSPTSVAAQEAYNSLSESAPEIVALAAKINGKDPLRNITKVNDFMLWLNSADSDPDVSKFKAKLVYAQSKLASVINRSRGGAYIFKIAKDLLAPNQGTDALAGVLSSHLNDLKSTSDFMKNYGRTPSPEDEYVSEQMRKARDYAAAKFNTFPSVEEFNSVEAAARAQWAKDHKGEKQ